MPRVFSYNVLSSHLSAPSHFTTLDPAHLSPPARWSKIMTKIGAEVDNKSILCLQELSRPWSGPLQTYLSNVDYELITGLYGRPFNGYMGIALAFPKSEYTLEEVWNENLADTVKWPRDPKEQEGVLSRVTNKLAGFVGLQKKWERKPEDR